MSKPEWPYNKSRYYLTTIQLRHLEQAEINRKFFSHCCYYNCHCTVRNYRCWNSSKWILLWWVINEWSHHHHSAQRLIIIAIAIAQLGTHDKNCYLNAADICKLDSNRVSLYEVIKTDLIVNACNNAESYYIVHVYEFLHYCKY